MFPLLGHAFPRAITCIKQLAENVFGLERHVKTLRVHGHRVCVYIYIHVYAMYCSMCVLNLYLYIPTSICHVLQYVCAQEV